MALPVLLPRQSTFVCANTEALNALAGCVMVTFRVVVQPLASVTVAVHVPAGRFVALVPLCAGVVFHEVV